MEDIFFEGDAGLPPRILHLTKSRCAECADSPLHEGEQASDDPEQYLGPP
jgi:hypothetical protein